MADNFEKFFEKIKHEMQKQTVDLTYSITTAIMDKIDEKLKPILEENKILKSEIAILEEKVEYLQKDKKKSNIIIFGVDETEKIRDDLFELINSNIKAALNMSVKDTDINTAFRIGSKKSESTKPRPILVSFTNIWKRDEIIRNKRRFSNIYVSEGFTKEVLEKRKLLQVQLKEERSKGNIAYLKYDKLVIKQRTGKVEQDKEDFESMKSAENALPIQRARVKRDEMGRPLLNLYKKITD